MAPCPDELAVELDAAALEVELAAGDAEEDVLELPPQAARRRAAITATGAAETGLEGMAASLPHLT
ncbi:MAG: hypothetical protein QOF83_194 [Solirubrobacteraceae bacterium]|nr:hypothetical protein [Solirubrobacteraceae bacterium]